MADVNRHMGPLSDEGTVAIIGGGPGGTSCAISLLQESARLGRKINVVIFEPKFFGAHYNQCIGVLSPPFVDLLKRWLDIELPSEIFLRKIIGYVLYSGRERVDLVKSDEKDFSWAVRRVELDRFLLDTAEQMGATVIKSRVTNLEFHPEDVVIYHESGCLSSDVLVGAFGLDSTLRSVLRKITSYRPPNYLEAVVTRLHPEELSFVDALEGRIHAFLPDIHEIEFAALVPKGNHISIVVAGKKANIKVLKRFLARPEVSSLIPFDYEITHVFKGAFPNGTGRGIFGDRYVIIGDSAGLVRPFKGKGINSAIITGHLAARTILHEGISRKAFVSFYEACRFLTQDLWYGRFVRTFVNFFSNHLDLEPILRAAKHDAVVREALYNSVSGEDTYRNIVRSCLKPGRILSILGGYFRQGADTSR